MSPFRLLLCVCSLALVACGSANDESDGESTSSELTGSEEAIAAEEGSQNGANKAVQPKAPVERSPLSLVPQDVMTPGDPSPWKGAPPR